MKKHILTFTLVFSLLIGVIPINACTKGNVDNDTISEEETILYTPQQIQTYEKIDELAEAKAYANQYAAVHNLAKEDIENPVDPVYIELLDRVESINSELVALSAKPGREQLSQLAFDNAVTLNGNLIEDFEDFENVFGSSFDLWAVDHVINASYGTFYVYDLMIQDKANAALLSTHIEQNGYPGFEVYAEENTFGDAALAEITSVSIGKAVQTISEGVASVVPIGKIYEAMVSIMNINEELTENDGLTVAGNTNSYRVYSDAVPTIHFVYVRESENDPWLHTYTTNRVSIVERHAWYMVFMTENGYPETYEDSRTTTKRYFPDRYGFRYTDAIGRYLDWENEITNAIKTEYIDRYNVYVMVEGIEYRACVLYINCPENWSDLYRYANQ